MPIFDASRSIENLPLRDRRQMSSNDLVLFGRFFFAFSGDFFYSLGLTI